MGSLIHPLQEELTHWGRCQDLSPVALGPGLCRALGKGASHVLSPWTLGPLRNVLTTPQPPAQGICLHPHPQVLGTPHPPDSTPFQARGAVYTHSP